MRWIIYNIYFPLALFAVKIFKLNQASIELFLIKYNNKTSSRLKNKINKLLILLPSCLQNKDCHKDLVENAQNCLRCGKCCIKDLLSLAEKYKLAIAVATGGRLARQILDETKADRVIAVACEKELISGIIDAYPLAVQGVINTRPFGPCVNTHVDIKQVEDILRETCQRRTR